MDEVSVLGAQLKLDNLSHAHMSPVLCNDCACENVACGRCICLHPPSIAREFKFPASEKNISSVQDEDRQETRTKMLVAVGFPVTSKGKSSILFEDQLDNYILQVHQFVGFFVVLSVV